MMGVGSWNCLITIPSWYTFRMQKHPSTLSVSERRSCSSFRICSTLCFLASSGSDDLMATAAYLRRASFQSSWVMNSFCRGYAFGLTWMASKTCWRSCRSFRFLMGRFGGVFEPVFFGFLKSGNSKPFEFSEIDNEFSFLGLRPREIPIIFETSASVAFLIIWLSGS